jgi:hypothetical protein
MLCCFNNELTNKTNKITKIFVFLSVLYVILLIFELTVKTGEHTIASYESSNFIRKFLTVQLSISKYSVFVDIFFEHI